jgi:ribonucleotide reductase beta subunit family protein with ferritin-like domain
LLEDTMWFEEELMGNNATDFFHSRPVEYSKNSQTFDADDLF